MNEYDWQDTVLKVWKTQSLVDQLRLFFFFTCNPLVNHGLHVLYRRFVDECTLSGCLWSSVFFWFTLPWIPEYICVWNRKQHLICKNKKPLTCHGGALWDFPVMFMYRNLKLSWSLSRTTCQRTCAFAFCCGRDQILLPPPVTHIFIFFSLIFRFLRSPAWLWQAKCFCRTLALSF